MSFQIKLLVENANVIDMPLPLHHLNPYANKSFETYNVDSES